jgi:hypothetical protein
MQGLYHAATAHEVTDKHDKGLSFVVERREFDLCSIFVKDVERSGLFKGFGGDYF